MINAMNQNRALVVTTRIFAALSVVPVVGVLIVFSLSLSRLGQVEIPILLVIYLFIMAAIWTMKRWGVYLYSVLYLYAAIYLLATSSAFTFQYMTAANFALPLLFILIPTCVFILGWLCLPKMEPVNPKDKVLIATFMLIVAFAVCISIGIVSPSLQAASSL